MVKLVSAISLLSVLVADAFVQPQSGIRAGRSTFGLHMTASDGDDGIAESDEGVITNRFSR